MNFLARVLGDLHKVQGGWAHCFRLFLRAMLMGPVGFATSGVVVNIKGEDILMCGSVCAILADGDGHAKTFDWKGAGSTKPCLRHFNVYRKVLGLSDRFFFLAAGTAGQTFQISR